MIDRAVIHAAHETDTRKAPGNKSKFLKNIFLKNLVRFQDPTQFYETNYLFKARTDFLYYFYNTFIQR